MHLYVVFSILKVNFLVYIKIHSRCIYVCIDKFIRFHHYGTFYYKIIQDFSLAFNCTETRFFRSIRRERHCSRRNHILGFLLGQYEIVPICRSKFPVPETERSVYSGSWKEALLCPVSGKESVVHCSVGHFDYGKEVVSFQRVLVVMRSLVL